MAGDLTDGAPSNAPSAGVRRWVALAYILAISIPPLGFILGLVLIFKSGRQASAHGVVVIVLSIIASAVWVVVVVSGALNAASSTSY